MIGAVIGAIGGAVIGTALSNYFKLKWPWNGLVTTSVTALLTVVGWFAGPAIYAAIKPIILSALNAGMLMFNKIQLWVYQILGYSKNWIATQATKFLVKYASKIGQTATVASKTGRSYQNSTLLIKTIMQSAKPQFDNWLTFGLKWVVKGTYWSVSSNGTKVATQGVYELVIDVLKMRIVHFVFKS